MSQKITFENFDTQKFKEQRSIIQYQTVNEQSLDLITEGISESIKINLMKTYSGKMNFSIQEVAQLSGMGKEFIRRRVKQGKIKSVKFGDRDMVNIEEVSRLLGRGVV